MAIQREQHPPQVPRLPTARATLRNPTSSLSKGWLRSSEAPLLGSELRDPHVESQVRGWKALHPVQLRRIVEYLSVRTQDATGSWRGGETGPQELRAVSNRGR